MDLRAAETGAFLEPLLAHSVLILMTPAQNVEAAGTGFYLMSTQEFFMVTAKHVLFGSDPTSTNLVAREATLLSYGKGEDSELRATNILSLDELLRQSMIRVSTNQDVAVVKLGSYEPPSRKVRLGNAVKGLAARPSLFGFEMQHITLFDEVRAGTEAYIVGFPRSLGQSKFVRHAVDPDRPLFRRGVIAGKNPSQQNLVVDAPVYQGNSGGPLILKLRGDAGDEYLRLAGVVSEFVPFERVLTDNRNQGFVLEIVNSGYAVAIPMDAVLSLLW